MGINAAIQKIRPYPDRLSLKKEIITSVCVMALGAVMGAVAKMTDSVSLIGEIGTEWGVWVFAASIVAAYSRYPVTAAINTAVFFLSMLGAYYLYCDIVLGFFPQSYFLGWLIAAGLSPFAGVVVWFSRGRGTAAAVASALPVSVLFAGGYPALYLPRLTMYITLVFGIILLLILPKTLKQKLAALGAAVLLAFVVAKLGLLYLLPF